MFNFIKQKKEIFLQFFLIFGALWLLVFNIGSFPLVDYDEATYAKIVVDTLNSGDILSLKSDDNFWFEKPPLYFWLAMMSVKLIGVNEIAFRLPSVILCVLSLWLVFLIVRKITKNNLIATLSFLILLFSAPFYHFALEMRLDYGVIMAMLFGLLMIILGWDNKKSLFLFFPSLAIGFLFKSVIVGLIVPIVLIFSYFYKEWSWLKNKFLWWGAPLSLIVLAPWHILQHVRFGMDFWNSYFIRHIFDRAVYGISDSESLDYLYYFKKLWFYDQAWIIIFLVLTGLLLFNWKKQYEFKKLILSSFFSVIFIFTVFTVSKTHIVTYILPIFPFLAIFIATGLYTFFGKIKYNKILIISIVVICSVVGYLNAVGVMGVFFGDIIKPFHYEQRDLARIVKSKNINNIPFYNLNWPYMESIKYYGDIKVNELDIFTESGKIIEEPAFILVNIFDLKYFLDEDGSVLPEYNKVYMMYEGKFLFLFYSDDQFILPNINL